MATHVEVALTKMDGLTPNSREPLNKLHSLLKDKKKRKDHSFDEVLDSLPPWLKEGNRFEEVMPQDAKDKLEDICEWFTQDADQEEAAVDLRHILEEIIYPRFFRCGTPDGIIYYEVVSPSEYLLRPIVNDQRSYFTNRVHKILVEKGLQDPIVADLNLLQDIWYQFEAAAPQLQEEPVGMAGYGEKVWSLHKSRYHPDPTMNFPIWEAVLNRLSDPEAFAAWWWAVYTNQYKGRKALWLQGEGAAGKSFLTKILAQELFGPAHTSIDNISLKTDARRFLAGQVEGKRLVVYPDANNPEVFSMEVFKNLMSADADPVRVERKNKTPYSAYLNAFMTITSNISPTIRNEQALKSRVLYVTLGKMIDKPNPKIRNAMIAELPGLLAYAKECFETLYDGYEIQVNNKTVTLMNELEDQYYQEFEDLVSDLYEKGAPDDKITTKDFTDFLEDEGIRGRYEKERFYEFLEKRWGCERKRSVEGNRKITCWYGLKRTGKKANGKAHDQVTRTNETLGDKKVKATKAKKNPTTVSDDEWT